MRQQLSVGAPELTVLLETIAGAVIRHSPWTAPSCGPSSLGSGVRWSKSPSAAACIGTTSAGPLNASAQIAPASTATTSFRARESANGVEVPHSGARSTPRVLRVPTHRRSQSAPRTAIVLAYLPVGASPVDREAQEFSGGTGALCRPWAATKRIVRACIARQEAEDRRLVQLQLCNAVRSAPADRARYCMVAGSRWS